jgi:hypothetical protein
MFFFQINIFIQMRIEKISVKDIPGLDVIGKENSEEDESKFSDWLCERFRKKDAMMESFYRDKSFVSVQSNLKQAPSPICSSSNETVIKTRPTVSDLLFLIAATAAALCLWLPVGLITLKATNDVIDGLKIK